MQAKFVKRLFAYLIDLFVFGFLVLCVVSAFRLDDNKVLINLSDELSNLNQTYLDGNITFSNYIHEYSKINYLIDKNEVLVNILNVILLMILYVFIPFFTKGQTIGKKLANIKIIKTNNKKLDLNTLIVRSLLVNFLGNMLISLALVFILKDMSYYIPTLILTIFELLLVIISTFMILYKSEKRGIHDYITSTQVVEVER